ncbi:efflux RND transporter periplasmic adaptor subunit [Synoicihabitans lomoniglobus]|uniref:HlyD family efflux transporter periplasmic adaptor subunit n=1 Tax=Synoicihabitans lomoniglobus TaxID=2909285 RepID=A0AAF0CS11_9BACT|nr:HlyD family efflux transporter periplasmic adaptor subunit [Opitutaceae bacterium LMO-M01]WED66949.1 HlyD family efflux transporter periplasmic adaptor subunit [Opitutaceae bacterium LMO-M01]
MDIPRPNQAAAKRKKRITMIVVVVALLGAITFGLSRLKPAAPSMDRNLVWVDTVKRGPMVRQVRGLGTLVPENIRWVAARTQARVETIILRPGAMVTADSVILELSNPDVTQAAETAVSSLQAAQAGLANLRVQLQSQLLAAESAAAAAKAAYEQARLRAEVNDELFADGLVSRLELELSKVTAEEASTRNNIEQKRFAFSQESIKPQLAVQEAEVSRLEAQARLRQAEADALKVKAGMAGVLSALPVEVGAQVQPGQSIARVADPTDLKAEIRIAETQAKDITIGQLASVDTRNGIVSGRVVRIDPAVQNGTVLVDVTLEGELPRGARPDLSVDGTIELERLDDVIYVGRPAFGQERSTVTIFKLDPNSDLAERTQVQLGRSSVNTIEIIRGLNPGDQVILSDMSQWDSHDRVQLN